MQQVQQVQDQHHHLHRHIYLHLPTRPKNHQKDDDGKRGTQLPPETTSSHTRCETRDHKEEPQDSRADSPHPNKWCNPTSPSPIKTEMGLDQRLHRNSHAEGEHHSPNDATQSTQREEEQLQLIPRHQMTIIQDPTQEMMK